MNRWKEQESHRTQQNLLQGRVASLTAFGEEQRAKIDVHTLDGLRACGDGGLVPVILWSAQHGWTAGRLVQKIGAGGSRILVMLNEWRIIRVKAKTKIIRVEAKDEEDFYRLIDHQEKFFTGLHALLAIQGGAPHAVPDKKGIQGRKAGKKKARKVPVKRGRDKDSKRGR